MDTNSLPKINGDADASGHHKVEDKANGIVIDTDECQAKAGSSIVDSANVGTRSEIKRLVRRTDKRGEPIVIEKASSLDSQDAPFASYSMVVKICYDGNNKYEKTTLAIQSPHILATLKSAITFYPGEPLDFEDSVTFEHPYMMLQHNRQELHEHYSRADGTIQEHLKLLLDFLEEASKEADKLRSANVMDFANLWSIFKSGTLQYQDEYGHERLYRLQKVGYGEDKVHGMYLRLNCLYTTCDGEATGSAEISHRIWESKEFVGASPSAITSLTVFPFEYFDGQDKLKAKLVTRGQRYLEIKGVHVFRYEGLHLYLKQPPHDFYSECADYSGSWLPATTHGRVVVDAKTFAEEMKAQEERIRRYSFIKESTSMDDGDPNVLMGRDVDALLCPPHVFGFCLETKMWCKFFIDYIRPATWVPDALDSLVLPTHRKLVIQSLVSSHHYPIAARDEARAKGKGLVFLLHGVPGSGKTLTAELVAEHTKRPLLNISTGELGSYEHRVSYELKRLLMYASKWRAIVLIDEADVFLEARQSGASEMLQQNALVAVFLRQLEYFQGIIFLTSNRVAVFDPAIRSRIHLALQYESPDQGVRKMLWKNKLATLEPAEMDLDVEKLLVLVQDAPMNGREISNAVNTARTLAIDQGKQLGMDHISTVVQLWRDFEETLNQIQAKNVGK